MGMGHQGNARDHSDLGDVCLGHWQGSRTCAPCADHKPALSMRTRALTTPFTNTQSTTIKERTPLQMNTSDPYAKRPTCSHRMQQAMLPNGIGKYVIRDAESVTRLGWTEFVRWRQGGGDFASLSEVNHPARRLLRQYKHCGAPVVLMTGE